MPAYPKQFRRIIFIGVLGTIIEWAEYAFYGYMAVLIAQLFFPKEDSRTSVMAAFALFAAGFLMRPLGAILVSHIADCKGRKQALLFSMLVMGIATFIIGILPTYETIGLMAPAFLLICRLIQGLAVASEMQGAAVFLIEHARLNKPYLAGSWPGMAAALGITLGGFAATLVAHASFDWAWRIPFIVGALSCFLALYLRQTIAESPIFLEAQEKNQLVKIPLLSLFRGNFAAICKIAAMAVFVATNVYVCNLYFVTYLVQVVGIATPTASLMTTIGELMVVIFFPLAGLLADKLGGIRLMQFSMLLFVVVAPCIFILAKTGNLVLIGLAQLIYALFDSLITAPMFKWLFDQFATSIRVTGINVSWNVAVALLGGTAPLIVEHLVSVTGSVYVPGFYVSVTVLVALLAVSSSLIAQLRAKYFQVKWPLSFVQRRRVQE